MLYYHLTIEHTMEFEFYAIVGGIMVTCFVVGGAMIANEYSPPEIRAVGSLMIAGGWVLLLVLVGFGSYEIWKRVREWNIERRSEAIDRKLGQLHIKERERELKRREREIREEEERRRQELRRYEEPNIPPPQPYQPPTKQIIPETKKSEPTRSPIQDLKSSTQISEEEPILKTGHLVPDHLIKKESIEEEASGEPEKIQSIADYILAVQQSPEMLCLLSLFKNPEHRYENIGRTTRSIYKIEEGKRSGSREQDVSRAMEELKNYGLVEITTKTEYQEPKKKKRTIDVFSVTDLGMELMKHAEEDKVTRWVDFLEKYKPELVKKK